MHCIALRGHNAQLVDSHSKKIPCLSSLRKTTRPLTHLGERRDRVGSQAGNDVGAGVDLAVDRLDAHAHANAGSGGALGGCANIDGELGLW